MSAKVGKWVLLWWVLPVILYYGTNNWNVLAKKSPGWRYRNLPSTSFGYLERFAHHKINCKFFSSLRVSYTSFWNSRWECATCTFAIRKTFVETRNPNPRFWKSICVFESKWNFGTTYCWRFHSKNDPRRGGDHDILTNFVHLASYASRHFIWTLKGVFVCSKQIFCGTWTMWTLSRNKHTVTGFV